EVSVVGQAVLEDAAALNRLLGLQPHEQPLVTAAAAYQRWGDRFTDRLSGEFAIALYDSAANRLIRARDGLGIRVLYVAETSQAFVVTNIVAAALAHPDVPADLDSISLLSFLSAANSGDAIATAFAAIKAVPEGHTLTL